MKPILLKMLTSKKFLVMLLGVAIPPLNAALGLGLNVEELATTLSPLIAYIVGQSIADHGKEAELLKKPF